MAYEFNEHAILNGGMVDGASDDLVTCEQDARIS